MDTTLINNAKESLTTERESLKSQLSNYAEDAGKGEWDASSKNTEGEEADFADTADNIEDLITNVPITGELESRLRDVEDALEKIKAGTYGRCEVCNEPISPERLEANPAARTCIVHAQ